MLDSGKIFCSSHNALQALVIEFVGGGSGCTSCKHGAHGNAVIFFRDVLMNDVVGETGESGAPAIEVGFDFVSGREFLDAVENLGGISGVNIPLLLSRCLSVNEQSIAAIGRTDLHMPKPRGGRAVTGSHDLLRLSLPAIRRAP